MAKQTPEIVGFSVGGIMPLEQVGFIMKEIIDRGGKLDLVQPFAEMRKPAPTNGHMPNNGVAGLLPAPAKLITGLTSKGEKRYALIVETLRSASAAGLRVKDIYAALKKKGFTEYMVRSWLGKLVGSGEAKQSPADSGFWHYGQAQMQTVAAAPSKYTPAVQVLLNAIASFGEAGGNRNQIMAVAKMKYWSMPHIKTLIDDGVIKNPRRNLFIAVGAQGAPQGQAAVVPSRDPNDTRSVALAFVREHVQSSRRDVVLHILSQKKITKASARQTLKRMVADKELTESTTGMISLHSK